MCSALETKRREQFNLSEAVQEKKKKPMGNKDISNCHLVLMKSFPNGQREGKNKFSMSDQDHEQRQ